LAMPRHASSRRKGSIAADAAPTILCYSEAPTWS
jgi:hypothetical protein